MMSKGSYDDFLEALRQRESSGDYTVVNQSGFLGAYQFGEAALVDLGFVTNDGSPFDNVFEGVFSGKAGVFSVEDFLGSPTAQDQAALERFPMLWGRIRFQDLEFYDGQTLNGVTLTKSGMLAGAHLLGVGGLRDFIRSGGVDGGADGNGTSIVEYIELLGDYETPATFVNNLELANPIEGGSGADILRGFGGDDSLLGFAGDDVLEGGSGDDLIDGGTGADILDAGSGTDTVFGGDGNDEIIVGDGADTVTSGAGEDVIKLVSIANVVTITDFEHGQDVIDFSQFTSALLVSDGRCASLADLTDAMVLVQLGGDTIATVRKFAPKGVEAAYTLDDAFLVFENAQVSDFLPGDDFFWG